LTNQLSILYSETEEGLTEVSLKIETRRELIESNRTGQDAIVAALHVLEAALVQPSSGREEAWAEQIARDLEPVVKAVQEHCLEAENQNGLVRELESVLGRHFVLRMVSREHGTLAEEGEEFLAALKEGHDVSAVRDRAARLSADLRRHQAHESDLIYEAFVRESGAGD
jgi:hypothetical protein